MLSTFTRKMLVVFFFIGLAGLLSAQADITGHWKVTSTANYSSESVLYGKMDYTNHTIHFGENGRLVISSDEGYFIDDYNIKGGLISYSGTDLTILEASEKELILVFEDASSKRNLELTLRPQKRVSEKIQSLLNYPESKKYTDFNTQGIYHRFDEESKTHRYIRFLPDGRLLALQTTDELTDFNYFNGAYIMPNDGLLTSNKKNYRGDTPSGIYVFESSFQKSEFSYTVIGNGHKLERHHRAETLRSGEVSTVDHTFAFKPVPSLAHWLPGSSVVNRKEAEYPFIHILLASKPQKSKEVSSTFSIAPVFPCDRCQNMSRKEAQAKTQELLLKYIYSNLQYPKEARKKKIEGIVVVKIIINEDGRVSNAEVTRSIGGGCDEAALEVLQKMERDELKWIPGKSYGIPVKVTLMVPVRFSLN